MATNNYNVVVQGAQIQTNAVPAAPAASAVTVVAMDTVSPTSSTSTSRRSTTPEPSKKKRKIDPVFFTQRLLRAEAINQPYTILELLTFQRFLSLKRSF